MNRIITLLLLFCAIALVAPQSVWAVTINTVYVGNVGNANDPLTGNLFGGVNYDYRMGETEVTNAQYVAFLNAVATTDPYGLYDTSMGSTTYGGITRGGSPGSYAYSVKANAVGQGPGGSQYAFADKPVVFVSWGDAARFSNWLNNGQPTTGVEDASTTEDGTYTLNGAVTDAALNLVTRNSGGSWFIPSEGEWYKAAYYDGSAYHQYPTGTNMMPDNNLPSADSGNSANFAYFGSTTGNNNYPMTDAGAYSSSASPYGTFDQGGNVWEWNEALFFGSYRGLRGGAWDAGQQPMSAQGSGLDSPTNETTNLGFRVATVPEPSSLILAALGLIGFAAWGLRKR